MWEFIDCWLRACAPFTCTGGAGLLQLDYIRYLVLLQLCLPQLSSALELEVSLQILPPSYCAVPEAEPSTHPCSLPRLSAWGTDSSISHLLTALGVPGVSP